MNKKKWCTYIIDEDACDREADVIINIIDKYNNYIIEQYDKDSN